MLINLRELHYDRADMYLGQQKKGQPGLALTRCIYTYISKEKRIIK